MLQSCNLQMFAFPVTRASCTCLRRSHGQDTRVTIISNPTRALVLDYIHNFTDRTLQVIIEHHVIKRPASLGHADLAPRGPETFANVLGRVPPAIDQPLMQRLTTR